MGFRAPVFKELFLIFENPDNGYLVRGNPDLIPESSHSVNAGVEHEIVESLTLSINLFANEIENLIFYKPLGPPVPGQVREYSYENLSAAYTRGVESQLQYRIKKSWRARIGYVFTDSYNREKSRKLEGRALHRGTFDLWYGIPKQSFEANLRGSIVGPEPYYRQQGDDEDVYETDYSPAYAVVNIRVSKGLTDSLRMFLGIENLLNTGDLVFRPIQPFTVYLGMSGQT